MKRVIIAILFIATAGYCQTALLDSAKHYEVLRNFNKAIEYYKLGYSDCKTVHEYDYVNNSLARCYLQLNDYKKVIEILRTTEHPKRGMQALAYYGLAKEHLSKKDTTIAIMLFFEAEELDSTLEVPRNLRFLSLGWKFLMSSQSNYDFYIKYSSIQKQGNIVKAWFQKYLPKKFRTTNDSSSVYLQKTLRTFNIKEFYAKSIYAADYDENGDIVDEYKETDWRPIIPDTIDEELMGAIIEYIKKPTIKKQVKK